VTGDQWGRKKGTGFGLREKINNKTRKSPCIPQGGFAAVTG
jgi:hypothetical protein